MGKIILKDTPLYELTLRKYEHPRVNDKRDLVRKFCLSIGLLHPGDSRDIIVDILYTLLEARKEQKEISSEEIRDKVIELRKNYNLPQQGIAASNIRRQLKRLRQVLLVEKIKNNYRITENVTVLETFEHKIEQYMLKAILDRIKDYCREMDRVFK